ncbi:TPA: multidrug efflux MFS transporter [Pseudomonas aeruginosa]|nr:multidrug efflux MFS transporter [Pseudomonas aeruginosa]
MLSAMLGAFMAVLDIQITNSSLKDIQGALAATLEEGSWISTSYLVAEIIMIPMTAWLVQLLSARRLAVMISVGFLVSSLLCSFAWNLESMIVFRAMQGFTGGALIPLAFTLALVKLPEHHRPKGMALFAITATFAPSIGGLGMGLYGSIYVLPLYLAQIQGYNAMQIGEVIMWMGIPQLFLIPLVPKLMKLVSPRLLCAAGFGLFGLASFFSGVLNPDFAGPQFNQIQLLRALGQPMIMVTISLIATAYLQPQDAGSASSLFNILRNLGGAIGIALLATLLDSRAKVYFDYLREALVPTNPQVDERLAQLAAQLGSQQAALGKLSEITHQQAMIMAYNDAFHVIGMVLAVSMLAVLLTRSLPAGIGARADAGAH